MEIEKIGRLIRKKVKEIADMPDETVEDKMERIRRHITLQKVVKDEMLHGNIGKAVDNIQLIKRMWDEMKAEGLERADRIIDEIREE